MQWPGIRFELRRHYYPQLPVPPVEFPVLGPRLDGAGRLRMMFPWKRRRPRPFSAHRDYHWQGRLVG